MDGFRSSKFGDTITKDPAAILDYKLDWDGLSDSWLDGDTIASVVWTVATGITQVTASHTTTTATIWLSGGTAGTSYRIRCTITTAAGRVDTRSFTVIAEER